MALYKIALISIFALSVSLAEELSPVAIAERVVSQASKDAGIFVGIYRAIDDTKGDFDKYKDLERWVVDPKAATNRKTGAALVQTFVLIAPISPDCPSLVNIETVFIDGGVGDLTPKTFHGTESSAFILALKKDDSWKNGDLYKLVGGYDSIIAKRDVIPSDPRFLPRYKMALAPDIFESVVTQLRDRLKLKKPGVN